VSPVGTIAGVDPHRQVIDEATATLDGVDAALARLSEGTYRTCEECGDDLADEHLAAEPTRRRCDAHATV
jgi:RNA polymerase-binding transcription factor